MTKQLQKDCPDKLLLNNVPSGIYWKLTSSMIGYDSKFRATNSEGGGVSLFYVVKGETCRRNRVSNTKRPYPIHSMFYDQRP